MTGALFHIMVPAGEQHRILATFNVKDEADLLKELQRRLPSLRQDHALVAVNEGALRMLLHASRRKR